MHPLSESSFAQQTSPVLTVTCARCLLTDGYYGFKMDLFAAGGFGLKPARLAFGLNTSETSETASRTINGLPWNPKEESLVFQRHLHPVGFDLFGCLMVCWS